MRSYLCLSNMSNLCVYICYNGSCFISDLQSCFFAIQCDNDKGGSMPAYMQGFQILAPQPLFLFERKEQKLLRFFCFGKHWGKLAYVQGRAETGEKRQGGKTTAWTPNYALVPVYKHPHMSRVLMSHTYRFLVLLLKPELTTVFVFACR